MLSCRLECSVVLYDWMLHQMNKWRDSRESCNGWVIGCAILVLDAILCSTLASHSTLCG